MEEFSNVWWWSNPNKKWLQKILDYIKASIPLDNDIILLHCEKVAGFDEESIPLTNYFFNLMLEHNSFRDERTMFLNLKDVISSIELHLGRQKKKEGIPDVDVSDEEIVEFYNKYISSFEKKSENNEDDKSILAFKEFLRQNNCLDIRLLLDMCLKCETSDISKHIKCNRYLILGVPSSTVLKQFISILNEEKVCSVTVETSLDISINESPNNQISDKLTVVHECIEMKGMSVNLEYSSDIGSATEEYTKDLFLSFLSLLVNSKNELTLSKALISPIIDLSHEAFTVLKHMSSEKEMPMCQVAVSYVTRIRLGGKGYAPPADCPMRCHLKGLELFVDTINQLQTVIEEDPCPRSAVKRLVNILKKKMLKCGCSLNDSFIEVVAAELQFIYRTASKMLESRISTNAGQICQGTLDILYHFINFVNANHFIYKPEEILSKKYAKRTPLNLPPLLGYFRSPDEESTCDTAASLNEDSCPSRSSIIQSSVHCSYFHHSESSEVSLSCVNSRTPSKLTFKGCLKENVQNQKKIKRSEDIVTMKNNRKRSILSEITNEDISIREEYEAIKKMALKIFSGNCIEETVAASTHKKQSKKEPKKVGKKFKQIKGQGKITNFFTLGKSN